MEQIEFLEYRTVDSIQLANPGRNLIDMIHEMESVQDWIKDYRIWVLMCCLLLVV